jgi:hypothetical protein
MTAGDPAPIRVAAATGFARSALAYDRGRPGYPDAAVDWLAEQLPARAWSRLAAGTGELTSALAARGCDVVAVEPVFEMRAVARTSACGWLTAAALDAAVGDELLGAAVTGRGREGDAALPHGDLRRRDQAPVFAALTGVP